MWSQSRLGANLVNGKRLPPWSLTRAMWLLTRAWARMSRSDSGAGWGWSRPVSPVAVALGVEQGSFRAGVEGFASDDESEAFGPSVGFDVVGEFDHMGTNRLRFQIFGFVVGADSVESLLRVVDPCGVGVVVLGWDALGKGGLPAWVVWGDVAEGFGYPVGASSDETEPDVAFCGIR